MKQYSNFEFYRYYSEKPYPDGYSPCPEFYLVFPDDTYYYINQRFEENEMIKGEQF